MPKKTPADVRAYLATLPPLQRRKVIAVRDAVLKARPSLAQSLNPWGYLTLSTPKVKYGFVLMPYPSHLNLQIFNGAKLSDALPQLEGTGKHLRHIKIPYDKPIDVAFIVRAVRLALAA